MCIMVVFTSSDVYSYHNFYSSNNNNDNDNDNDNNGLDLYGAFLGTQSSSQVSRFHSFQVPFIHSSHTGGGKLQ